LGKTTRFGAQAAVDQVLTRVRGHAGRGDPAGPVVESVRQKKTREAPPLLFDLTSLQRTANRRFGLSAQTTLEAAQALYERHKILTYPRTDARYLSSDMAALLPTLLRGVAQIPDYAGFVAPLLAKPPNPGKRVFDDKKIHDHHAIVPTGKVVAMTSLGRDEHRVFDLVVRRFLGAFYPDAEFAVTRAVIRVGAASGKPPARSKAKDDGDDKDAVADETLLDQAPPPPDRFVARGRVRLAAGWQEVAGFGGDDTEAKDGDLPPLADGQRLDGTFAALAKATKPPPRHTEATLLGAMETAGKDIEDDELRAAMKDTGLGTPATRAATIETLVKRRFIERDGKQIVATALGVALIEALPVESLSSPELTGQWEARLSRIARGQETRAAFMNDIVRYVRESVDAIRGAPVNRTMATNAPDAKPAPARGARKPRGKTPAPATQAKVAPRPPIAVARAVAPAAASAAASALNLRCPRCKRGQMMAGKRGWGCSRWREGCGFVVWFDDNGKRRSEADLREIISQHA
jgi:DNA topoisomerase-3